MKPRFLFDENVEPVVRRELIRKHPEIEIVRIGDPGIPPRSTPDPEILVWMEEHNYILVTHNRSSMPTHIKDHFAVGRHYPGILWIRRFTHISKIITSLDLIWDASEHEEYFDIGKHIPL